MQERPKSRRRSKLGWESCAASRQRESRRSAGRAVLIGNRGASGGVGKNVLGGQDGKKRRGSRTGMRRCRHGGSLGSFFCERPRDEAMWRCHGGVRRERELDV